MEVPPTIGRYRVERFLGQGAFATVWLAHDDDLSAPVAVKVLAAHWADHRRIRRRFTQEARMIRRADSPHVVQVHDVGALPDGRPFFVMGYADRGTLRDRLAVGPVPWAEAVEQVLQIAAGVAALHDNGIVHRDLKPANILVRSLPAGGERLLVADLGIAGELAQTSGLTVGGGTPGYMAPEQLRPGSLPDERADVYGLAAVAHHLFTGGPPGAMAGSFPGPVGDVVARGLADDRAQRWPNVRSFAAALARAAREEASSPGGETADGTRVRERARRVPFRPGWRPPVALALAAAAVAGGVALALTGDDQDYGRWLRPDADLPGRYRAAIVEAGTWCTGVPGLSPALVAAMLKAESGFDRGLADATAGEYGIARWTPDVLAAYLPPNYSRSPLAGAMDPEIAIPAIGRFLCTLGPRIRDVPGDPALNLAGLYRSSSDAVRQAGGVPARWREHVARVGLYLRAYLPLTGSRSLPRGLVGRQTMIRIGTSWEDAEKPYFAQYDIAVVHRP
ncbi:serine/threonine-protein kinase [Streptosporangium sp. NPDC020072]|uniref:serine/threonine-protein kinase n=1 Tax=Streptosporangium sp. NPDC020072 TaxID=3154788 RepID=UPI003428D039